ncbi:tetratricopeptide repeat protein [Nostoc sp. FACHB-152]|uniref:CHAT domain-containing protein n=1 Tax=Nostoc sp. FACHB-152 TaxID=2692837 RepID=UPI001684898E|nr:tetratricopeptide repeat protein [Nostoc sp. FACHB-152]MBD2447411.1 tetratricopeptide repeat protein [Nostoc sp. FACHB-152]
MLTQLWQWLKTHSNQPVSKHTQPLREQKVGEPPPELTNGDLELLYTQLLEGVHQGRGQQWAIKYLQRMEDRISTKRWIDWLLEFGEKLLISPVPNQQLAMQMVELGELNIGKVGELSYDIGIRIMTRNTDEWNEEVEEPATATTADSEEILPNSPGQNLLRNLGETLWEYEEETSQQVADTTSLEVSTENVEELVWEYTGEQFVPSSEETAWNYSQEESARPQENSIDPASLWEDPEEDAATSDQETDASAWEYPEEFTTTSSQQATTEVTPESLWEYPEPEFTTISPQETPTEIAQSRSIDTEETFTTSAAVAFLPPSEEDVIGDLTQLLLEYPEYTRIVRSAPSSTNLSPGNSWDQSLANLAPNVAYTLDELFVRLEQSAHLVQQLAVNLTTQHSQSPATKTNPANTPIQAQAWFYQGLQQAKSGDLIGAIASYDRAIELQPQSHEYWFNRGLTLFHLERFAEAVAAYDTAIDLKQDHYKAWYNRGGTLGELGLFEEAIASFNRAIEIQPNYAEAWASKALALLKLGQIWEAIASYDRALELEPQDPETWYYRGIALAVTEHYEDAIASYNQALELQPDYYEVWIDRGVVLFNLQQWSEAIASWDKALSSQPDFYLAWYNRGVALDNLGKREEAIASYKKAIAIKPDFHLAWYNQAVALFYLARYSEAIVSYDNALNIKLDYWEAWIGRGAAVGHVTSIDTPAHLLNNMAANSLGLQQGGYAGKIASYEQGLKHIRPDTHPEGWGRLHFAIGNTYYEQGKKQPTSRHNWRKAVVAFNQALLTLSWQGFPLLHLEILQSLIKTLLSLGQTTQAQELQQRAANFLQQLLNDSTRTDENKKQLALKFAPIGQLAVDFFVESGDLVEAWELAEQGKNTCLQWLLFGWQDEIYSPNYRTVQQLLNPTTAIIYWHISPAALHTFIIKDEAPSPILLFIPVQEQGHISFEGTTTPLQELPLPEAARRLIAFENWLEDWSQGYHDYYDKAHDPQTKSNHPWRSQMQQRLVDLQKILEISSITQELEGITNLILIPHRDMHRLPLHMLFNLADSEAEIASPESKFTITYLPSIQTGLNLPPKSIGQLSEQKLISVESPTSADYIAPKFAKLESQVISQMFALPQRIQEEAATKNIVENALADDYNIFHFTGQVINNLIEPTKSELALAGKDKLTLDEIYQKNLISYNLAILSACRFTGFSNQNITTEYVSLVNGFLCAATPRVVSTLWNVESSASALLIIEFYRRLQANKSPATALTEATTWLQEVTARELTKWYEDLIKSLHPNELRIRTYLATHLYRLSKIVPDKQPYNHPYYWAAFTLTGIGN